MDCSATKGKKKFVALEGLDADGGQLKQKVMFKPAPASCEKKDRIPPRRSASGGALALSQDAVPASKSG